MNPDECPAVEPAENDGLQENITPELNDEDSEQAELHNLGFVELILALPDGLLRAFLKSALYAICAAIFGFCLLLWLKAPQCSLVFVLAGWLAWSAASILFDFQEGKIIERAVICSTVERMPRPQNRIRVVFTTNDVDMPLYFEYFLPGRNTKDFSPHMTYLTYVRESTPNLLLGWKKL